MKMLLSGQTAVANRPTPSSISDSEILKSIEQGNKKQREEDSKNSSNQEIKKSRAQEIKTTRKQEHNDIKDCSDATQKVKKSRMATSGGITRCPANITIREEYQIALNVLAAKRQVRPWTLLDEAIRQYLITEGEL